MSVPNSLIIPSPHPSLLATISLFSKSVSLFCKQAHLYHVFLDSTYEGCCMMFLLLCLSSLILKIFSLDPSMWLQTAFLMEAVLPDPMSCCLQSWVPDCSDQEACSLLQPGLGCAMPTSTLLASQIVRMQNAEAEEEKQLILVRSTWSHFHSNCLRTNYFKFVEKFPKM